MGPAREDGGRLQQISSRDRRADLQAAVQEFGAPSVADSRYDRESLSEDHWQFSARQGDHRCQEVLCTGLGYVVPLSGAPNGKTVAHPTKLPSQVDTVDRSTTPLSRQAAEMRSSPRSYPRRARATIESAAFRARPETVSLRKHGPGEFFSSRKQWRDPGGIFPHPCGPLPDYR